MLILTIFGNLIDLVENDNQNESALFKKYSTNHCFSKSLKYGGNTKKRGFTIDNLNVIKNKHTQLTFHGSRSQKYEISSTDF